MRRRTIVPGLILLLVLTSLSFKCGGGGGSNSDPTRKYARALDDMAGGINAMIKAKRQLGLSGRLSRDEELRLTNQLLTANNAVTAAFNAVKSQTTIDASNRSDLIQLFSAVSSSVEELGRGISSVRNPDATLRLQKVMAGIVAALTIIKGVAAQNCEDVGGECFRCPPDRCIYCPSRPPQCP